MKTTKHYWNISFKCLFLVFLVLFIIACKKEQPTANIPSHVGVYTLVSIDGKPVPTNVSEQGDTLQVLSGTFTINADGTCSTKTTFVASGGTEQTNEVNATYTMNGSTLTMKWEGAGITTGTIDGNTFTMTVEGMVMVYRK